MMRVFRVVFSKVMLRLVTPFFITLATTNTKLLNKNDEMKDYENEQSTEK